MEQDQDDSSSPSPSPENVKTAAKNTQYAVDEDEEDIWPEDVENYFQEALKIYPPIGRRKLLEHGKMYGRNELIAKYILQKTGKVRTRKQVSSHIQVLGKKTKKTPDSKPSSSSSSSSSSTSSSASASAASTSAAAAAAASSSSKSSASASSAFSAVGTKGSHSSRAHDSQSAVRTNTAQSFPMSGFSANVAPGFPMQQVAAAGYGYPAGLVHMAQPHDYNAMGFQPQQGIQGFHLPQSPVAEAGHSTLRGLPVQLKHFYAYLEHASAPLSGMVNRHYYVSLNGADFEDSTDEVQIERVEGKYFGLRELFDKGSLPCFFLAKCYVNANSQQNYGLHALFVKYESRQRMTLKCSTTVYSFGKAVVEKIQVEDPILEYNIYAYYFNHSPMCDYMVQFIEKLKGLNDTGKMNRVLENFSCLQVIIDTQTNATLMCTAFLFEVAEGGVIRNRVMRLVPTK